MVRQAANDMDNLQFPISLHLSITLSITPDYLIPQLSNPILLSPRCPVITSEYIATISSNQQVQSAPRLPPWLSFTSRYAQHAQNNHHFMLPRTIMNHQIGNLSGNPAKDHGSVGRYYCCTHTGHSAHSASRVLRVTAIPMHYRSSSTPATVTCSNLPYPLTEPRPRLGKGYTRAQSH